MSKLKMVMLDTICGSLLGLVELECIDSGFYHSSSECQIELLIYMWIHTSLLLLYFLVKQDWLSANSSLLASSFVLVGRVD